MAKVIFTSSLQIVPKIHQFCPPPMDVQVYILYLLCTATRRYSKVASRHHGYLSKRPSGIHHNMIHRLPVVTFIFISKKPMTAVGQQTRIAAPAPPSRHCGCVPEN
jgi:hypothetical protein